MEQNTHSYTTDRYTQAHIGQFPGRHRFRCTEQTNGRWRRQEEEVENSNLDFLFEKNHSKGSVLFLPLMPHQCIVGDLKLITE